MSKETGEAALSYRGEATESRLIPETMLSRQADTQFCTVQQRPEDNQDAIDPATINAAWENDASDHVCLKKDTQLRLTASAATTEMS